VSIKGAQLVVVTDFGTVLVPANVEKRYRDVYYRKRAPKKSVREAMAALENDVMAMSHYAWLMEKEMQW
jgi:hypothetical protein